MLDLLNYLREEIVDSDVEVKIGLEVTQEKVRELSPVSLVIATGASSIVPRINGLEKAKTVHVTEALLSPHLVGDEPVVIGGGVTGCETALYLSQLGRKVTIVEKLSELMPLEEIGYRHKTAVLSKMLREARVRAFLNSEVIEVAESTAMIKFGRMKFQIGADTIVLSIGFTTDKHLIDSLKASCGESYVIGDCANPGRILEAIHDGDRVGRAV